MYLYVCVYILFILIVCILIVLGCNEKYFYMNTMKYSKKLWKPLVWSNSFSYRTRNWGAERWRIWPRSPSSLVAQRELEPGSSGCHLNGLSAVAMVSCLIKRLNQNTGPFCPWSRPPPTKQVAPAELCRSQSWAVSCPGGQPAFGQRAAAAAPQRGRWDGGMAPPGTQLGERASGPQEAEGHRTGDGGSVWRGDLCCHGVELRVKKAEGCSSYERKTDVDSRKGGAGWKGKEAQRQRVGRRTHFAFSERWG